MADLIIHQPETDQDTKLRLYTNYFQKVLLENQISNKARLSKKAKIEANSPTFQKFYGFRSESRQPDGYM